MASMHSGISDEFIENNPFIRNFIKYYPWACMKLFPNYYVNIEMSTRGEIKTAKSKMNAPNSTTAFNTKIQSATLNTSLERMKSNRNINFNEEFVKGKTTQINAVIDCFDSLIELVFERGDICPGMIKLINLIINYHKKLNYLNFKCKIDQHIIYEVSKLLPVSNITHLCLDGTFVPQGNYYLLLSEPSALKSLSLARCSINDEVIIKLVSHLCFPKKTCESLIALNLSTNYITDKGAKCFGTMLRGNRHLNYLNLSGNRITDVGLNYILDSLIIFPLTFEEKSEQFHRLAAYIDYKTDMIQQLAEQFLHDQAEKKIVQPKGKKAAVVKSDLKSVTHGFTIDAIDKIVPRSDSMSTIKPLITDPLVLEKALNVVESTLGPYDDPIGGSNIKRRDNKPYCLGNNTLNYLNVAYNDLTFLCLKKILNVLQYQIKLNRKPKGLMRVVIEGNRLPESCFEYDRLEYLFGPFLVNVGRKSLGVRSARKPSTNRISVTRI